MAVCSAPAIAMPDRLTDICKVLSGSLIFFAKVLTDSIQTRTKLLAFNLPLELVEWSQQKINQVQFHAIPINIRVFIFSKTSGKNSLLKKLQVLIKY